VLKRVGSKMKKTTSIIFPKQTRKALKKGAKEDGGLILKKQELQIPFPNFLNNK